MGVVVQSADIPVVQTRHKQMLPRHSTSLVEHLVIWTQIYPGQRIYAYSQSRTSGGEIVQPEFDSCQIHDFKAFYINVLQVVPHVSRLPFLPIRVRGIFSYLLAMKWITSIPVYHQLSNSGLTGTRGIQQVL
jgi:hypothetical protein